jgi:hypothetical protein
MDFGNVILFAKPSADRILRFQKWGLFYKLLSAGCDVAIYDPSGPAEFGGSSRLDDVMQDQPRRHKDLSREYHYY